MGLKDAGQQPLGLLVEAGVRLVEKEERRTVEQGPGQGRPPLHAVRERTHAEIEGASQREPFADLGNSAGDVLQPVHTPVELQVLPDGQGAVEEVARGRDAHHAPCPSGVAVQRHAVKVHVAAGGAGERRQDADERGLAGAVGAEDREVFAPRHVQVHAPERRSRSVENPQLRDLDGCVHSTLSSAQAAMIVHLANWEQGRGSRVRRVARQGSRW